MIPAAAPNHQPYNVIMTVTPEIAFRWLEGNTHNRPISQTHVNRLAHEMRAGRWCVTHQGIAFDEKGLLIDGQHRLCAIIEADMPVELRVFYNESPDNRYVVDTGERRSNLDVLTITGQVGDVNRILLATLRATLAGMASHPSRMSPADEAAYLTRHRQAVEFAVEQLGSAPAKGLAAAQTRAVVARAWYAADHGRLARFCDVLRSGMAAEESDHIVITLRDFLVDSHRTGQSLSARRLRYAKTEWALAAFLDGRQPKRLHGTERELFPLPEEIKLTATA